MLTNILPLLLPLTPWVGSKVMLHPKSTRMKHKTPCKQIFCQFTHPLSLDGVKLTFLEEDYVTIHVNKLKKSAEHYAIEHLMVNLFFFNYYP